MLDSVTKKRIDDLRNILVGKIPSPQSQVEQITTGLIYKFMYDMDVEAVAMGGVPSFFVDDYEKYSWKHLFDPKLGGADKVQLYSDAIENMYTNPSAPQLFREIFKNSFLPFKDPSTLNMFLKEINEFHYSHSEKLGDAFEYLLSFMGSQGDAGQFRTPRHIIDFIVEIVNPQKNETILDPACGTAGFLISSYKHILSQNTDKKLGDKLNASDRKQVGDNLVGYDISPDMTRISLVNMYLHQFASPQIHEYDTLSSEDRWNEYYDVILANPPFFSPTGGIQPHTRFGVQSTRAEVLFVDYIMEHLKPTGRAGIVVPEGIIFQNGNAYKTLRKKLVEDCLVGVISLPAGVFQPYSGVKTSILVLDKELNQKSDSIFFAKVENDGFSLGAQRTVISKNDLPKISEQFQQFCNDTTASTETVPKQVILDSADFSLSLSKFQTVEVISDFDVVKLRDLVEVLDSQRKPLKKADRVEGRYPYYGATGVIDYVNDFIFEEQLVLIGEDGAKWGSGENSAFIADGQYWVNNHAHVVRPKRDKLLDVYLTNVLNFMDLNPFITGVTVPKLNQANLLDIEIPLPPIEVQQQIVDELEGYQKIIDGCRQVIENYKPTIDIDPSWEMVELGELASLKYGLGESAEEQGTHRFVRITDINEFGLLRTTDKKYVSIDNSQSEYVLTKGDVLMARTGATYGKCLYFEDDEPSVFAGYLIKISLIEKVLPKFFWIFSQSSNFDFQKKQLVVGGGQPQFNANTLKKVVVPVPPIEDQERIIGEVILQQKIVEGNFDLMDSFQTKIQDRISKVWGGGVEPLRPSNEEIMEQIESGVLVHPRNDRWHDFFKFLKSKIPNDIDIPNPLILGGSGANDFSKNQRLKEHLKVAEQFGVLTDALEFLSTIPDSQWEKSSGNLDPNELDYWQLDELHRKETEEKWFFKTVENMQVNLATMDTDKAGRILFVTETGWVFDEITCSDFETAVKKLRQNGFKRCDEDEKFSELFDIPDITIPETFDKELANPIYSSGKFWRD